MMSKRQNAIEVLNDSEKLKSVRDKIKRAEYHFGLIDNPKDFLKTLVWLGPVSEWNAFKPCANDTGKIYEKIAPKDRPRSVGAVAERILSKYSDGSSPEDALAAMYKKSDWFAGYLHMYARFDPRLVGPIWVRSIRPYEKKRHDIYGGTPESKLYIADGNHRALTYALHLLSSDEYKGDNFVPVPILWSKSWKHILHWAEGLHSSRSDSPPDELKRFFEADAKSKYFQNRFDSIQSE